METAMSDILMMNLMTTVIGTVTLGPRRGSRGCARLVLAAMAVKSIGAGLRATEKPAPIQ
jgi:hypothetical protein